MTTTAAADSPKTIKPAEQPAAEQSPAATPSTDESGGTVVAIDDTPRPPASAAEAAERLDLRTFPLIEGAKISGDRRQIGQLIYEAPGPVQAAFDFQRAALEERGWQLLPDARLDGDDPMANFTSHGFVVNVSVSGFSQLPNHVIISIHNHGNVLPGTLPVPAGVEVLYAMPGNVSYVTTDDTEQTADAVWDLLLRDGWQPYGGGQDFRWFKKNAILLTANVMAHPAQPGKTFITYATEQLSADIPVPPDVADPRYTDSMKRLHFDHEGEVPDVIAAFYNGELANQGWQPTSEPVGDDPISVVYRNDAGDMMTLDMKLFNNLTRVDVEHFTAAEVAAMEAKLAEAATLAQQESPEQSENDSTVPPDQIAETISKFAAQLGDGGIPDLNLQDVEKLDLPDNLPDELANELRSALSDVANQLKGNAPVATESPAESQDTADAPDDGRLLAEKVAVPDGATDIERDPDSEMVIFRSDLKASEIADFFRKKMTVAGWGEIADETFVDDELGFGGVGFEKGDLYINLSIQNGKPDSKSRVLVMGDGIRWPGDEDLASDDSEAMEEETVPAQFVGQGACEGTIDYGDEKFELKHALVAIRPGYDEKPVTHLYLCGQPFTESALSVIAREDASTFDLLGSDFPNCLEVTIEDSYTSVFAYVDGASINYGGDEVKSDIKKTDQRIEARVHTDKPHDVFDKPFRFDVTIDLELKPGTAVASEPMTAGLAVDDRQSMLVPRGTSEMSMSGSPYKKTLRALIEAEQADVMAFYRDELEKRGWHEDASNDDGASPSLSCSGDEGKLTLELGRRRGQTMITLTVRNETLAREHKVVPPNGKAMLMLGNATEAEIEITIDDKAHRLAAEQGGRDPSDALKVQIEPGKHTIKVAGSNAENVDVPAGATWGVIAIPGGGVFTDQVY
ncbi:MAG: hypothetical protein R3C10_22585 [Pirellulales bacterium]